MRLLADPKSGRSAAMTTSIGFLVRRAGLAGADASTQDLTPIV
jgi:hypothetical protein